MSFHTTIARLREASFAAPVAGENPNTCRVGRQDLRTALHLIDRLDADLRQAGAVVQGAAASTDARTGNSTDHQAAWFASIEQGQANERHNAQLQAETAAPGDAQDAARYRGWRDAMIAENAEFRQAIAAALPSDVGETRPPTAAEWDSAIDAALAAQQGKGGEA